MDYNEIQLEELEALQAIYPNELKIINREYPNINVSFYFRPNEVCFFIFSFLIFINFFIYSQKLMETKTIFNGFSEFRIFSKFAHSIIFILFVLNLKFDIFLVPFSIPYNFRSSHSFFFFFLFIFLPFSFLCFIQYIWLEF